MESFPAALLQSHTCTGLPESSERHNLQVQGTAAVLKGSNPASSKIAHRRNIPTAVHHRTTLCPSQRPSFFWGLTAFPGSSMPSGRDGAEQAGWLPAGGLGLQEAEKGAHRSQRHTGKGLPRHRHQQQQQYCSHGDRKERTRLDQSRLEQTPPTITIIHNPHLPPPAPLPPTFI